MFTHPRYIVREMQGGYNTTWLHGACPYEYKKGYPRKSRKRSSSHYAKFCESTLIPKEKLQQVKANHLHFVYEQEDFNRARGTCLYPRQNWDNITRVPDSYGGHTLVAEYIYGPYTRLLRYSWTRLYTKEARARDFQLKRDYRGISLPEYRKFTHNQAMRYQ